MYRLIDGLSDLQDAGLPLVPSDPSVLFIGKEKALADIWHTIKHFPHSKDQRLLWEIMVESTGMKPEDEHTADILFIQHCFLVCVARCVASVMRPSSNPDTVDQLTHGYINWLVKDNQAGLVWFKELLKTITRYDWRRRQTDVFRVLYQKTIAKAMRKVYGEYYTPDWLAQMLVERVLDTDWCEEVSRLALFAVRNQRMEILHGRGMLDPTCGSGTFLYHAAKRLLHTEALTSSGVSLAERSQAVCALIHGFDIHPVAVEFSRTNLLRALPAPLASETQIGIHQGDSLLSEQSQDVTAEGTLEIRMPNKSSFFLPHTFVRRANFVIEFEHLIRAAEQQEDRCPPAILVGKPPMEKTQLTEMFEQVKIICREEGNGIWWYHATNLTAPWLLASRKVDRIVANPPWVRMNEIQVYSRKASFTQLAQQLKIWSGGKRATSLDIGGIFVLQCCRNFLKSSDNKTAWLLNDASRRAGSWKKFRDQFREQVLPEPSKDNEELPERCGIGMLTFSDLRGTSAPFTGAASCAWFSGCEEFQHSILLADKADRITRQDAWSTVQGKIQLRNILPDTQSKPSAYVNKKGNPIARNGATVFPQALVRVERIEFIDARNTRGITGGSTQKAWKSFNHRVFEVPSHWVREIVFSRDLLVFCTRLQVTRCILPCTEDGTQLLSEEEANKQPYWRHVSSIYEDRKGIAKYTPATLLGNLDHLSKLTSQIGGEVVTANRIKSSDVKRERIGSNTPTTLLRRVDHQASLSSQLEKKQNVFRVTYNSSGQYLRASRIPIHIPVEHKCYRVDTVSANEAMYLTTILNADGLQPRFQASRESDRDFDTHFWRKVPIPRYDANQLTHRELVKFGKRCEKIAIKVRDSYPESTGQLKLCKEIRAELQACGLSQSIDKLVAKIV